MSTSVVIVLCSGQSGPSDTSADHFLYLSSVSSDLLAPRLTALPLSLSMSTFLNGVNSIGSRVTFAFSVEAVHVLK